MFSSIISWDRTLWNCQCPKLVEILGTYVSSNEALFGNWLWRFMNEKGNLWRRVFTIKYGEGELGWSLFIRNGSYGYRLWRCIAIDWQRFSYFSFEYVMIPPFFSGMIIGVWRLHWDSSFLLFLFWHCRDASVPDSQERVSDINFWLLVLVQDSFVKFDTLVSFRNKLNEA